MSQHQHNKIHLLVALLLPSYLGFGCVPEGEDVIIDSDTETHLSDRIAIAELLSTVMASEAGRAHVVDKVKEAEKSGEPLLIDELLYDKVSLAVLADAAGLDSSEVVGILADSPSTEVAMSTAGAVAFVLVVSETDPAVAWVTGADSSDRVEITPATLEAALIISPAGWHDDHGGLSFSIRHMDQALGAYKYPQGLTCGMAYRRSNMAIVDGYCGANANKTLANILWAEHSRIMTGDWGLDAGNGFYHQSRKFSSEGVISTDLRLPKGTTCGFKHTINAANVSCLGFDAAVSCPSGWIRRYAVDWLSGGGKWAWCEYQDPKSLCTTQACLFTDVPPGTVCGVTHTADVNGTGQCNGVATKIGCPLGWQRYGFFDWGRAANIGIGWCVRP